MAPERKYNLWKTGIILSVKKYPHINAQYPWCVVAFSKTIWERDKIWFPIKILDCFRTFGEAEKSYWEIKETIRKRKFPR